MKKLMAAMMLLTLSAFAQSVQVLDSSTVVLDSNVTVLKKVDVTPSTLNLVVPVPTTVKKCEQGFSRKVTGYNGSKCGYEFINKYDYHNTQCVPGAGLDPHFPTCIPMTVPKLCTYSVCDRSYTVETVKMKTVKLSFEDYAADDEFEFSLDQYGNVTLLPTMTSPACTKLVIYGKKPSVDALKIQKRTGLFSSSCK